MLDWEMGAIGDPRADLGYLVATYTEPGGAPNPLGTSPVTAEAGFPSRDELIERYRERSGRDVEPLAWFEALALWKAAVFCEAIYGRFMRGELGAEDTRAARVRARRQSRATRSSPPANTSSISARSRSAGDTLFDTDVGSFLRLAGLRGNLRPTTFTPPQGRDPGPHDPPTVHQAGTAKRTLLCTSPTRRHQTPTRYPHTSPRSPATPHAGSRVARRRRPQGYEP